MIAFAIGKRGGVDHRCPVPPTDLVDPFEATNEQVESQADQADHDHAGDDQVIALAGVAGVDDQVAETRS